MAVLASLNRIRRSSTNTFASKYKMNKSLGTLILLSGCDTWTLLADSEKRIQAFETKCTRKPLCILYLEHNSNDWVRSKINCLVGPQEPLLATVKKRKLASFGHVTRHDSLSKTIPLGATFGVRRRRGRQRKWWMDNIKERLLCQCQNSSQRPSSAEKNGKASLLNHLSCPPDDPIGHGTELNWSELNFYFDPFYVLDKLCFEKDSLCLFQIIMIIIINQNVTILRCFWKGMKGLSWAKYVILHRTVCLHSRVDVPSFVGCPVSFRR